jgi:hypothetical protein
LLYVIVNYFCKIRKNTLVYLGAVIAQVVEHVLGKNEVIGANPINGSSLADVAQLVEHRFRKAGVDSSILSIGS